MRLWFTMLGKTGRQELEVDGHIASHLGSRGQWMLVFYFLNVVLDHSPWLGNDGRSGWQQPFSWETLESFAYLYLFDCCWVLFLKLGTYHAALVSLVLVT